MKYIILLTISFNEEKKLNKSSNFSWAIFASKKIIVESEKKI